MRQPGDLLGKCAEAEDRTGSQSKRDVLFVAGDAPGALQSVLDLAALDVEDDLVEESQCTVCVSRGQNHAIQDGTRAFVPCV